MLKLPSWFLLGWGMRFLGEREKHTGGGWKIEIWKLEIGKAEMPP
jgi:hypothetical protein